MPDGEWGCTSVKPFEAPVDTLGGFDAEAAASLITAVADVALVVDRNGVICDVSIGNDGLSFEGCGDWVGRRWADTVTPESRPKVAALLQDAGGKAGRRWRHINYPVKQGADIPLMYSALPVGDQGRVVALGRDLRNLATLQQRLVDAQQSMEQDYLRLRHMETRYRLLFEMVADAVLIVDGGTQKILEINPAAAKLMAEPARKLVGRHLAECFAETSRNDVVNLLSGVLLAGRVDEVGATLIAEAQPVKMSASMFRQEGGNLLLVHLQSRNGGSAALPGSHSVLLNALDAAPDGFVVTDMDGRVITANRSFMDMVQVPRLDGVVGESLDRWLGRSGVDMSVLVSNLKQRGAVRLFASAVRGLNGAVTDVEISGIAVAEAVQPCLGFAIRDVGRRLRPESRSNNKELPRSAAQLTELVGRVPLKDIVSETTDMIERLCIEAALELTRDNRASASEMLGLSRQSLYVKLRRFGLGDLGAESDKA